jgi:hypothetical protein
MLVEELLIAGVVAVGPDCRRWGARQGICHEPETTIRRGQADRLITHVAGGASAASGGQRHYLIRRYHDGKADSVSSSASWPIGSGSSP